MITNTGFLLLYIKNECIAQYFGERDHYIIIDNFLIACRFVESAMHYAKTKASFEEVTLKFMAIQVSGDIHILKLDMNPLYNLIWLPTVLDSR